MLEMKEIWKRIEDDDDDESDDDDCDDDNDSIVDGNK